MVSTLDIFEKMESNVRVYSRSFPAVFHRGKNAHLFDEAGRCYIDFFSGAGALNYGHNPDAIKKKIIEFIQEDRVMHALDMHTSNKREFLENFENHILAPRNLDYKVQFCGPTGANAVEAALKLARLNTKRVPIASFSGGWHGMTSGCLSVTANKESRASAGYAMPFSQFFPFPDGPYPFPQSISYIESLLNDPNSGLDKPAAVILETIQAEGGIYLASNEWLRALRDLCDRHEILMIVDDIQVGCGRSGSFFSFESSEIIPDIVCLSKSIGGYGLPFSLLLFKRELDVWKPGQHTGTFRANQLSILAATIAIQEFWSNDQFQLEIRQKEKLIFSHLKPKLEEINSKIRLRGRGLIWGIDLSEAGGEALSKQVANACFAEGLIIERCGRSDVVLKLIPPLTIENEVLEEGCDILLSCIKNL